MNRSVSLSDLFDLRADDTEWEDGELNDILEHQLSVPLVQEFGESGDQKELNPVGKAEGGDPVDSAQTFQDVFEAPEPDLQCLQRIKVFAQRSRASRGGPLPDDVAAVLYYASILIALIRCEKRITSLSNQELARGVRGLLSRGWLNTDRREWLEKIREASARKMDS